MKYEFKKQFPILDGCEFTIDGEVTNYKYLGGGERVRLFRDREIALYCLSKRKVQDVFKDIMNKIKKTSKNELERDKEVIERILQQIDISYEQACDVYDEMQRQKNFLRIDGIRDCMKALRLANYDVSYTSQEVEEILQRLDGWYCPVCDY